MSSSSSSSSSGPMPTSSDSSAAAAVASSNNIQQIHGLAEDNSSLFPENFIEVGMEVVIGNDDDAGVEGGLDDTEFFNVGYMYVAMCRRLTSDEVRKDKEREEAEREVTRKPARETRKRHRDLRRVLRQWQREDMAMEAMRMQHNESAQLRRSEWGPVPGIPTRGNVVQLGGREIESDDDEDGIIDVGGSEDLPGFQAGSIHEPMVDGLGAFRPYQPAPPTQPLQSFLPPANAHPSWGQPSSNQPAPAPPAAPIVDPPAQGPAIVAQLLAVMEREKAAERHLLSRMAAPVLPLEVRPLEVLAEPQEEPLDLSIREGNEEHQEVAGSSEDDVESSSSGPEPLHPIVAPAAAPTPAGVDMDGERDQYGNPIVEGSEPDESEDGYLSSQEMDQESEEVRVIHEEERVQEIREVAAAIEIREDEEVQQIQEEEEQVEEIQDDEEILVVDDDEEVIQIPGDEEVQQIQEEEQVEEVQDDEEILVVDDDEEVIQIPGDEEVQQVHQVENVLEIERDEEILEIDGGEQVRQVHDEPEIIVIHDDDQVQNQVQNHQVEGDQENGAAPFENQVHRDPEAVPPANPNVAGPPQKFDLVRSVEAGNDVIDYEEIARFSKEISRFDPSPEEDAEALEMDGDEVSGTAEVSTPTDREVEKRVVDSGESARETAAVAEPEANEDPEEQRNPEDARDASDENSGEEHKRNGSEPSTSSGSEMDRNHGAAFDGEAQAEGAQSDDGTPDEDANNVVEDVLEQVVSDVAELEIDEDLFEDQQETPEEDLNVSPEIVTSSTVEPGAIESSDVQDGSAPDDEGKNDAVAPIDQVVLITPEEADSQKDRTLPEDRASEDLTLDAEAVATATEEPEKNGNPQQLTTDVSAIDSTLVTTTTGEPEATESPESAAAEPEETQQDDGSEPRMILEDDQLVPSRDSATTPTTIEPEAAESPEEDRNPEEAHVVHEGNNEDGEQRPESRMTPDFDIAIDLGPVFDEEDDGSEPEAPQAPQTRAVVVADTTRKCRVCGQRPTTSDSSMQSPRNPRARVRRVARKRIAQDEEMEEDLPEPDRPTRSRAATNRYSPDRNSIRRVPAKRRKIHQAAPPPPAPTSLAPTTEINSVDVETMMREVMDHCEDTEITPEYERLERNMEKKKFKRKMDCREARSLWLTASRAIDAEPEYEALQEELKKQKEQRRRRRRWERYGDQWF